MFRYILFPQKARGYYMCLPIGSYLALHAFTHGFPSVQRLVPSPIYMNKRIFFVE